MMPKAPLFDAADRRFMKQALALAEKGLGLASPNPSVGCLIVRDGKVAGRGWHEFNLLHHAEIRALEEAEGRARNATIYVTLEPCCHHGRTPPCVDKLIQAGIRRAVIALIDPNLMVAGRGIEFLRSAGIQVDVGLMSEEAQRLIEPFACHVTTKFPLVVSKVGMSLDGKIGTGWPEGRRITSPESREFGQDLRFGADALLVGVGTVLSDDPELTYRGSRPRSRPLTRVILDARLRTPPGARLFQTTPRSPILIFCGTEAPGNRREELQRRGGEIITIPCPGDELDLKIVLRELGMRNMLELLVEGGSSIHWSFLAGSLVDKFYFVVAPLVLGGKDSIPSVGGAGYRGVTDAPRFRISRLFSVGPDVVFEAYPSYSRSIISPWLFPAKPPSGERGFLRSSRRK